MISLPEEPELASAEVGLAGVADPMGTLGVQPGMRPTVGQRHDMIEAGAHWMRVFEAFIHLLAAQTTSPAVALEDLDVIEDLGLYTAEASAPTVALCAFRGLF